MYNFHIGSATLQEFWKFFVMEYFGLKTAEELAATEQMLRPYTVFQFLIWLDHEPNEQKYIALIREALAYM